MSIDKARTILKAVAEQREQWGRHSGFASYAEHDVLDALVFIHLGGYLDMDNTTVAGLKEEKTKARRQTAAANARSTKFQNKAENAQEQIRALADALEEAEKEVCTLQRQLHESIDA